VPALKFIDLYLRRRDLSLLFLASPGRPSSDRSVLWPIRPL